MTPDERDMQNRKIRLMKMALFFALIWGASVIYLLSSILQKLPQ